MLEHVSLRCSDSKASRKFYERALKPLGNFRLAFESLHRRLTCSSMVRLPERG